VIALEFALDTDIGTDIHIVTAAVVVVVVVVECQPVKSFHSY
jgi:hypothetical protein